jgi:hypothetical protein
MIKTNTCGVVIGRLLEITVDAGYRTAEDVDAMMSMITSQFAGLPTNATVVIAADWRGVRLMPPDVAKAAHRMLTTRNPRIERSAMLVDGASGLEMLQFVRLLREAQHPARRIFETTRPMQSWLREVLNPAESVRLAAFLSRPAP